MAEKILGFLIRVRGFFLLHEIALKYFRVGKI